MNTLFVVAMGSALGGALRFFIGQKVDQAVDAQFPWGTLFVNVLGCFLIGALSVSLKTFDKENLRLFLLPGFLGGFTTFSAFSLQSLELFQRAHISLACAHVLLSLLACLLATGFGTYLFAK